MLMSASTSSFPVVGHAGVVLFLMAQLCVYTSPHTSPSWAVQLYTNSSVVGSIQPLRLPFVNVTMDVHRVGSVKAFQFVNRYPVLPGLWKWVDIYAKSTETV